MKNIVIYYSFDGNTRFIAQTIAQSVDADILELKPVKKNVPKGFMKYFWGGKQVTMREKPELMSFEFNPSDYDVLFIGTPVWAWSYAPALASLFTKTPISGKRIALFCCCGGAQGKVFDKMKRQLSNNTICGELSFIEPLCKDSDLHADKARRWAELICTTENNQE